MIGVDDRDARGPQSGPERIETLPGQHDQVRIAGEEVHKSDGNATDTGSHERGKKLREFARDMLVHIQDHLSPGHQFYGQRRHPRFRFRRDIDVRPFPSAQAHQPRRRRQASREAARRRHRHPAHALKNGLRSVRARRNGDHLMPGGDETPGNLVIHALVQRIVQYVEQTDFHGRKMPLGGQNIPVV
ncbi:MAG: hypothetical protein BWY09_02252 [Candidatus Hydrogenedentes bacterium ADurb.Bin179]|nr:MAG: hypothetical protein BWY09_02252 [Candidatus Hydrogenedentes bacterium ADurb.Bin179]